MTLYFLDASALGKLYVQEPGTDRLLHLAGRSDARFVVLSLAAVEARSAIRRRQRAGDLDEDSANLILAHLQAHLESRFVRQAVNDALIDTALEMVDRYALRAYDAMQLAGAIVADSMQRGEVTFVCSDRHLLNAASSERLAILDPTE